MTLGQQKPGSFIDNEADSDTFYCKTPKCLVFFFFYLGTKFSFARSRTLCVSSSAWLCWQGHKNIAAHERQPFQPLTCSSLSHAGCLLRSGDFKSKCYVLVCISMLILCLLFFIKKNIKARGAARFLLLSDAYHLQFSKSDDLYVYIVMPTVPMKCLPADSHLSNHQNGSINEPNGTWAIPHQSETASATSCIATQTSMAALHSEETIRTNCSRVQQSRPGTIIYEPNHLWVSYARTKHQLSACKLSQSNPQVLKTWENNNSFSFLNISRVFVLCPVQSVTINSM